MENIKTKPFSSKVISARLYLHAVFITFIMSCWPIYYLTYSRKTDFKWAEVYGPLVIFFYGFMAICIYLTVFVVFRNRPHLKRSQRLTIKIGGGILMIIFYIVTRWFVEQRLADWVLGMTNYPRATTFRFFVYDNMQNTFFMLFGSLFVKFMDDWYVTDHLKSKLEKQNLRLELDFLKSQVNPHFLFNTLNNIQSYIVQDEKMKSIELIGRLSEFMRFALYECNEEYIELNKEISMLSDYVELERVRCDDRVKITFETTGNFADYKIPPLLLMPFVENAFKHGADDQLSNSWIKIIIHEQEGFLDLLVENNFSIASEVMENNFSVSSEKEEKSGGIGLQNVKKRLKYYFSNKQNLELTTDGNVFKANLKIQLN